MNHLKMQLSPDLISKDKAIAPFWNLKCAELQENLWLPHHAVFGDEKIANFVEEKVDFWKTIITPKVSEERHCLLVDLSKNFPVVEKSTTIITRKIRIYPLDGRAWNCVSLARRAGNLAVAHFKNISYDEQMDLTELRIEIKKIIRGECEESGRYYEAEIVGEAVRNAFKTKRAIIKKRMKGEQCDYSFKSCKSPKQSYIKQRLPKNIKKMFHITEKISEDSYRRTTTISLNSGRWFLNSLTEIEIPAGAENQGLRVLSIDPGVRIFVTTFSLNECCKYGENFWQERLFPVALRLDKLIGLRAKHVTKFKKSDPQFFHDEMRHFNKRIYKLKNKMTDLVADLHRRIAGDILSKADVILLPTFETKEMSSKIKRKIHSKTVRAMLGLSHYKFKQTLKWLAKKFGKIVIDTNEAFTSKTRSWNGIIDDNLGSKKEICDGIISVHRDVDGARGNLLRALSR